MAVWIILIQLVAGFFVGLTSFGSNLFGIPLMALLIDIKKAVVISLLATLPIWFILSLIYHKNLIWRELLPLSFFSLISVPLGTWLLAKSSAFILLLSAGLCLLAILMWQILQRFMESPNKPLSQWVLLPAGLASGIMIGAIGMGGPPLLIYAYLRNWSKIATIAGGSFCSFIQMLAVMPFQGKEGLLAGGVVGISFWAAAAGCLGMAISFPVVKRVNESVFRNILIFILAFSAVTLLVKAILLL